LFLPFLTVAVIVLLRRKKETIDGDVVMRIRRTTMAKIFICNQKQINNKEPFYVALEKQCFENNEAARKAA
jgi:hypothetical protein